jgi:hypothetical protein
MLSKLLLFFQINTGNNTLRIIVSSVTLRISPGAADQISERHKKTVKQ